MRRNLPTSLIDLTAHTIRERGMLPDGQGVLAAVSGGADSTAMAVLLDLLGHDVVAAHVDHGLHPASRMHAEHCRRLAAHLGVPFEVRIVEVRGRSEAAAREARYEALEEMADALGMLWIATGHTLDDDAETVLMRLGRGGFPLGIPPTRGRFIRPLIRLRRSDTVEVCRRFGIEWADDPTNTDMSFTRNLIRRRVLTRFGDGMILKLAALGSLGLRKVDEAQVSQATSVLPRGRAAPRAVLEELDEDAARSLLRRMIEDVTGARPSERLVGAAVGAAGNTGSSVDLPGGVALITQPESVVIRSRPPIAELAPVEIPVPGMVRSPEWGIEVVVEPVPPSVDPSTAPRGVAYFDADALGPRASVRQWRAGDRMTPLGMEGSKKLQDLFTDAKVPRYERRRVPVLTAGGEIAWVVGVGIDDRYRLREDTERALRIRVRPLAAVPGHH